MVNLMYTARSCNVTFVLKGQHDHLVKNWVKILPIKCLDVGASWKRRSSVDSHVTAEEIVTRIETGGMFLHEVTLRDKYSEIDEDDLRVAISFRFQLKQNKACSEELSNSFDRLIALNWPEADTFENRNGLVNYRFRDLSRSYSQFSDLFCERIKAFS